MFITLQTIRARLGEEDAIIALHQSWIQKMRSQNQGFISGDLYTDLVDSRSFISIFRFDEEFSARKSEQDPEWVFWFKRVASLSDTQPIQAYYQAAS